MPSRTFAVFLNFLQKAVVLLMSTLLILTLITVFRDEFHLLELLSSLNDVEVDCFGERLTVLDIHLKNSIIFYLRRIALVSYFQIVESVALSSRLKLLFEIGFLLTVVMWSVI